MIDWYVFLAPLLLLPIVLLFVFVGCTFHVPGIPSPFGQSGDIPVPGDYLGEGVTRAALFRPSTGQWFIFLGDIFAYEQDPSGFPEPPFLTLPFGNKGDIPVPGDYTGKGITNMAVFRPADGTWHIGEITNNTVHEVNSFKFPAPPISGDIPLPPGKYLQSIGVAVFRPSDGTWHIGDLAGNPTRIVTPDPTIGVLPGDDIPLPGDYQGNGGIQVAFFRKTDKELFVLDLSGHAVRAVPLNFRSAIGDVFSSIFTLTAAIARANLSLSDDILLPPGNYFGTSSNGILLAFFQPPQGVWFLVDPTSGDVVATFPFSAVVGRSNTDLPAVGEYDGNGKSIREVVFRPPEGKWIELPVIIQGGFL